MFQPREFVRRAASLEGESEELGKVVSDPANHGQKLAYAAWLTDRGDARGKSLSSLVEAWIGGDGLDGLCNQFDPVWQTMCGIGLLKSLQGTGLHRFAPAICASARAALLLSPDSSDGFVGIGVSKFGGHPDLPEQISWPELDDGLMTFAAQIRLEDLQGTQVAQDFPASGLLSFFVADESATAGTVGRSGEAGGSVIIYTPDASKVARRMPNKEFLAEGRVSPECLVTMQESLEIPYCGFMFLGDTWAEYMTGVKRSKQLGLAMGERDLYQQLYESQLSDAGDGRKEAISKLGGWAHPTCVADDPDRKSVV